MYTDKIDCVVTYTLYKIIFSPCWNGSYRKKKRKFRVYLRYGNEVGKQVFLYSFSWNLEELELVVTSMTSVNFG
ncbi:hypothetical protein Avbf_13735 [Armadillidium vulgare]|nr:hypothetical protein Avbf_13735 [Armadillidium vulgare]